MRDLFYVRQCPAAILVVQVSRGRWTNTVYLCELHQGCHPWILLDDLCWQECQKVSQQTPK